MTRFPIVVVAVAVALSIGAVVGIAAAVPAVGEVGAADARLLAASDPFAAAPSELRLELTFVGANGAEVPLEIWRKGDDQALVRFLAPKDAGKFVLRHGREAWLLAPGAKEPVKMAPALAPAGGAALDELLSLRLARDYVAATAVESGGVVTFDLEAARPDVDPPRVRWAVDRERGLPLRAEFRTAEGRVRRMIEFRSWRDEDRRIPGELVAKDLLRAGAPLVVRIVALEAREVPDALFDLRDPTARRALPPPGPR
jgi:hypothetical protein